MILVIGALLGLGASLGSSASPAARAAEAGLIEGQVVARNGAVLAGTQVLLEIATGAAQPPEERTATAGDDGRFRFEDLPLGGGRIYLLRVTYEGGNYFQEVAFADGAPNARAAPVEVYPATRDAAGLSFLRLNMIFSPIEGDLESIGIIETGAFRNGGDRAYIGPANARDATSLRFGLPVGAGALQPAQGLTRDTLMAVEDAAFFGFATLEAIPPGERQFAYLYRLAPQGRGLDLVRVFPYRTELFQLYLPAGARVEGGGAGTILRDEGETTLPNGQRFRLYTARDLAPNSRLSARIANLPTGGGGVNPLLPAMALFALLLGSGLIVAYGRRRGRSPRARGVGAETARGVRTVPGNPTKRGGAAPNGDNGAGSVAAGEDLAERRRRLLMELADLDERYEAGGLAEPEYRRRRAACKSELVAILRELETAAGDRRPARS